MNDQRPRRYCAAHARRWRPNGRVRSTSRPDLELPHPLDDLIAYADGITARGIALRLDATIVDLHRHRAARQRREHRE